MAQDIQPAAGQAAGHDTSSHGGGHLGPLLCWAVVFADLGTSVYYTPGILYNQVGRLAGFFVFLTLIAFLLLTLKYAEVSVRFPEGGGVVTVATRGINPWAGALGGMFILVDYFLTAAISSLSGLLYFQAIVPSIAPWVLPVTLVVMALLGLLNWWGIKESASVSLVIATLAFFSDLVILLLIFIHVPPSVIPQVFAAMFSGKALGPLTILTGFAGAFLAFSGLESISQLSPVMRLPRKRTVSAALAVVVITVGITSPLLTMFSTVLLTDPKFSKTIFTPHYAQFNLADPTKFDPNQFISLLAGAYGGRVLEVAVAVTASALLIFASNTAIIGSYHVFLALSRMKFFPNAVERMSKLRGTPYISIMLATGIPMAVLIAVKGNVNTLGDLYAFGLLGAFTLTCLSLDIIRFRERHGGPHVGADVDPELVALQARGGVVVVPPSLFDTLAARWLSPELRVRLRALWKRLDNPLANFNYYIGFVTTAVVAVAWCTNLYFKPDATKFGGGITLLGVAIAALHFRYLQQRGEPVVFPDTPMLLPNSWLVVLSPKENYHREVIQAAVESAGDRTLAFLYLAPPTDEPPPRIFEINDRFGRDREAQRVLSRAKRECTTNGISAKYLYAVGGAKQVFDIARRIRPEEIVAAEQTAKRISHAGKAELGMAVTPDYVRYQPVDGVNVAHNVLHDLYARLAKTSGDQAQPRTAPPTGSPPAGSRANAPGVSGIRPRPFAPSSATRTPGNQSPAAMSRGDAVSNEQSSANGRDPRVTGQSTTTPPPTGSDGGAGEES